MYGSWEGLVAWKILRQSPLTISTPGKPNSELALSCLSQVAYFLRFYIPTFFRRKTQPPIRPPKPRPQANSYFRWFSSYHLSPQKMLAKDLFLRIFQFHCFSRALTSENWPNPLFQIKPSQAISKEILFQASTPCQGSFNSLFRWTSDLSIWAELSKAELIWAPGNRLPAGDGGITRGEPQYTALKTQSKNPSRQSLVREWTISIYLSCRKRLFVHCLLCPMVTVFVFLETC